MPVAVWPLVLPQSPLRDSYTNKTPNQLNRSDMDSGPAKVRPKGKSRPDTISVTYVLTKEQLASFNTFVRDTLVGGAVCFDWPHPVLGDYVRARMVPQSDSIADIKPYGQTLRWQVSFSLEVFLDAPIS